MNEPFLELPLTDCRSGEEGEVLAIDGDCAITSRLRELGIESGVWVRVAQEGSPVIIHTGETRLCLRAEQAASIRVRLAPPLPVGAPGLMQAHNSAPRNAI